MTPTDKFFHIPHEIFNHPKVARDGDYVLVLVHLYRLMNQGQVAATAGEISFTAKVEPSKVRRILAFLERDGHIGRQVGGTNTLITMLYGRELHQVDEGSAYRAVPPEKEAKKEENKETNKETNITKKRVPPSPRRKLPTGFSAWYAKYPRKIAKEGAIKAWERVIDLPPLEEMIEALLKQRASETWTKEGGKYIPYPATYLNGRRWEDEVEDMPTETNPYAGINWETSI